MRVDLDAFGSHGAVGYSVCSRKLLVGMGMSLMRPSGCSMENLGDNNRKAHSLNIIADCYASITRSSINDMRSHFLEECKGSKVFENHMLVSMWYHLPVVKYFVMILSWFNG